MVRLPRDISGRRLIKALARLGYQPVAQKGSHIRLYTAERGGNRVIVTDEQSIPVGTLQDTLKHVAQHFGITLDELLSTLKL